MSLPGCSLPEGKNIPDRYHRPIKLSMFKRERVDVRVGTTAQARPTARCAFSGGVDAQHADGGDDHSKSGSERIGTEEQARVQADHQLGGVQNDGIESKGVDMKVDVKAGGEMGEGEGSAQQITVPSPTDGEQIIAMEVFHPDDIWIKNHQEELDARFLTARGDDYAGTVGHMLHVAGRDVKIVEFKVAERTKYVEGGLIVEYVRDIKMETGELELWFPFHRQRKIRFPDHQ